MPTTDRQAPSLLESSLQLSNALMQTDNDSLPTLFRSASNDHLNGTTNHTTKRPRITRESVFRFGRSKQPIVDAVPTSPSPPPAQEEKMAEVRSLLDELRLQLMAAQSDKAMLESSFETEKAELLRTIHEKINEKTEAESRAVYHFQQVELLRKSNKELESELETIKGMRDDERIQLRAENSDMKQELRTLKREYESTRQDWSLKEAEYVRERDQLKITVDALTQQQKTNSELLKQRLDESTDAMEALASCDRRLKRYQYCQLDPDEVESLHEELHLHVLNVHRLEKEIGVLNSDLQHYKSIYQNVEKLREQKYELEHQLRNMAVFKDKCVQLEVENAAIKRERAEWASFLENADNIGFITPYAVCRELNLLRSEKSSAAKIENDLSELIKSQETLLLEAEKRILELNAQIREKDNLRQVDQVNTDILMKDKQLLQKEIGILREQLKSYDIEEITYMSERYDSAKTQRLNELEGLLGQYRVEIEALRTMMTAERTRALQDRSGQQVENMPATLQLPTGEQIKASLVDLATAKIDLLKRLSTLDVEFQLKAKELEVLQKQIDILRHGLVVGGLNEELIRSVAEVQPAPTSVHDEDIPMTESKEPKQRILQLKNNPASREQAIRQSMLDDLKKENQELIARLQQSNDETAMAGVIESTIPPQSFDNLQAEKEQMVTTVAQKEKRILRMQQVWAAKVREYHEAVASLLGYKVDFSADGMVRLASMYADPNDISFVFKSSENDQGTLKIVGANKDMYMKTLESSYNYCVNERGSIPAFLSAVTMELIDYQPFNRDHEMTEEPENHEEAYHDDSNQDNTGDYYEIEEDSEDVVYEDDEPEEQEDQYDEEDDDEPLQEYEDIEEEEEEHHDDQEFDHHSFHEDEDLDDEEAEEEGDDEEDGGDEDGDEGEIPHQEPTHYIIDDDDDD
ncbi:mitotic checkpoint protein-domain-containing protein [Umbelopsis sp. AD052]|nr:mitotic checkpoint protein-domain-containing protein [Umbelopsis sp. AD052]